MPDVTSSVVGVQTDTASAPRNILWSRQGAVYLPAGVVIDAAKSRDTANTGNVDVLRPGLILGKVTASSKYAPSILGQTAALHDTSAVTTTMTLPASVITEIQRRIGASGTFKIVGPPTAAGTVAMETVTYSAIASSTTLTITATIADFAAGSLILPNDGSDTFRLLLDCELKVTTDSGTNADAQAPSVLVAGLLNSEGLTHYSTDTSVKAWIKAQLNTTTVGPFRFSDSY